MAPALSNGEEISVLDNLLWVARYRKVITRITGACIVLSVVIAISTPSRYTSSAKVIRETSVNQNGTMAGGLAALRGFGFNIGSGSRGLTADTYPEILKSREVRQDVAKNRYFFADIGDTMTLVDYYTRPSGPVARFLGVLVY